MLKVDIQIGKVIPERPQSGSIPYGCANSNEEFCQENDASVTEITQTHDTPHGSLQKWSDSKARSSSLLLVTNTTPAWLHNHMPNTHHETTITR